MNLIADRKVKELSLQVFEQTLNQNATKDGGTFTRNLSEQEENAVVELMLEGNPNNGWDTFVKRYGKHYPLFNSSIAKCLQHLDLVSARTTIEQELKRFTLNPEQAIVLLRAVLKEDGENCRYLAELYCQNCHAAAVDNTIEMLLRNIDDKFAGRAEVNTLLTPLYIKKVGSNTKIS